MGTNYYLDVDRCAHCGRPAETLHVGKSSAGWRFLFQGYPERGLTSRAAWLARLREARPGDRLYDEYGGSVEARELADRSAAKQAEPGDHLADYPDAGWHDPEGYVVLWSEFR